MIFLSAMTLLENLSVNDYLDLTSQKDNFDSVKSPS